MDSLFRAYAVEAIRSGEMDPEILARAADECDAAGDAMTAHQLRVLIVEADGARATELAAKRARARLRLA